MMKSMSWFKQLKNFLDKPKTGLIERCTVMQGQLLRRCLLLCCLEGGVVVVAVGVGVETMSRVRMGNLININSIRVVTIIQVIAVVFKVLVSERQPRWQCRF